MSFHIAQNGAQNTELNVKVTISHVRILQTELIASLIFKGLVNSLTFPSFPTLWQSCLINKGKCRHQQQGPINFIFANHHKWLTYVFFFSCELKKRTIGEVVFKMVNQNLTKTSFRGMPLQTVEFESARSVRTLQGKYSHSPTN